MFFCYYLKNQIADVVLFCDYFLDRQDIFFAEPNHLYIGKYTKFS